MISRFFIDRPVFASVLSIALVLAGLASLRVLPVAQFPEIVPPEVVVTATYPGAGAEVVAATVGAPLERHINGLGGMLYMRSTTTGSGTLRLTVTFEVGTDPDRATIEVSNRVQRAEPQLPDEVRRQGVQVQKRTPAALQVVVVHSPDQRHDTAFVSNYALLNVIDELKRVPGVGDAALFGAKDYAIRIWLRPDRLAQYGLTPGDVAAAVREQNSHFAAGRFGEDPAPGPRAFTYAVTSPGRLADPKEFGDIVLRADPNGAALRLRDVARVELGIEDYTFAATFNGAPSVPIAVYRQPGASALEVADAVEATMRRLGARFPEGLAWAIPFDTTRFVRASIREVVKTFAEALVLVAAVVFLFLQSGRATVIPLAAVPVSIAGTFVGMYLLGFSINLMTLFGMVLAVGIVVDDAIVVVENVERVMATGGLPPRQATIEAMRQVTGPVVAIVLVLCAVFVPVCFLGGLAGELYRQFAVTIAVSVVISGAVALTLTPALCAAMLRPRHGAPPPAPFRQFARTFEWMATRYVGGVRFFLGRPLIGLALLAALLGGTWGLFRLIPGGLVPPEDQGYVLVVTTLPPAASLDRTKDVAERVTRDVLANPAVSSVITYTGFDVLSRAQKTSSALLFVTLKDWSERTAPGQDARRLAVGFRAINAHLLDGEVASFNPPPITGISPTGGFEAYLQDRGGAGLAALSEITQRVLAAAKQRPELAGMRATLDLGTPQYRVAVDREKAKALDVPIDAIFEAMQSTFGSLYVNDFTLFGRSYRVNLSSEAPFRQRPDDLRQVFVRSRGGSMVSLDVLLSIARTAGPDLVDRFNGFPAAKIVGGPAPGHSSGQALAAMQEVADAVLPRDYALGWAGAAQQELAATGSGTTGLLFGVAMVFLVLAAQYERWSLPLAVLTAVPFAAFGAVAAIWLRGTQNDLYFQIGLVTLVALAAKNSILLVEFAARRQREGMSRSEAALEAVRLRFRPIVMTSLTFILGALPLATSTGAGSASRHSAGTGVIGGMLAATFLAPLFVPLFFRLVSRERSGESYLRATTGAPAQPARVGSEADS